MPFFQKSNATPMKRHLSVKNAWLAALFGLSSFLLFYNAYRYSLPLGYGGLYALMAEEVASNSFSLPFFIPYYGPGKIPFAYPPLAFYVIAILVKMDVSVITSLRFVPPLLSLLSLFPLYLLVKYQMKSDIAAGLAVLYAASSPSLYVMHTWSAGSVRATAFFLMLCGFYLYARLLREGRLRFGLIAGIFLGLTILTHLFYALAFAIWVFVWFLIDIRNSRVWKSTSLMTVVAFILVSPWLYMMASRYGTGIFLNAFASHDNSAFMDLLRQPQFIPANLFGKLSFLMSPLPVFVLMCIGFIFLVVNRQIGIPLGFMAFAFFLSGEGSRFLAFIGAILFGVAGMYLWDVFRKFGTGIRTGAAALAGIVVFQMLMLSFQEYTGAVPVLNQNAFEAAKYVRENTPETSRYLFVAGQSEAEWFPYLLQREPFVSKWGSEWLGTYYEQRSLQMAVTECKDNQSLECLRQLRLDFSPEDVLITKRAERRLASELENFPSCERVAAFGRYLIWQGECLTQ